MSSIVISGDTSGSVTLAAPAVAGTNTLTLPVGTATLTANGLNSNIVAGTAVASTSGTSIDFTSIPSWVKRITVMFTGVSVSASVTPLIQIGSGSFTTTGYLGSSTNCTASTTVTSNFTNGFGIRNTTGAGALFNGCVSINLLTTNTWSAFGVLSQSDTTVTTMTSGSVVIGGTLDRVRITTSTGTDTFDAGSINILYE